MSGLMFMSLFLAAQTASPATKPPVPAMQTPALAGEWTVDLSVDSAKPYTKPMTLKLAPDGSVNGSFYDSEILAGR